MAYERQIKLALDEVAKSNAPNFSIIARKYNINRSTLSRRARGITRSRQDIASYDQQLLTNTQEEVLIKKLNWLSDKGLHATARIVQNIVEEFLNHTIGKGWVYRFIKRHKDKFKSIYLKGFDRERKIADNPINISHFYKNVCLLFLLISI